MGMGFGVGLGVGAGLGLGVGDGVGVGPGPGGPGGGNCVGSKGETAPAKNGVPTNMAARRTEGNRRVSFIVDLSRSVVSSCVPFASARIRAKNARRNSLLAKLLAQGRDARSPRSVRSATGEVATPPSSDAKHGSVVAVARNSL